MKIVGIRIKNAKKLDTETLLEFLRYAGIAGRCKEYNGKQCWTSDTKYDVEVFYVPKGITDIKNWVEQNKARIKSFGVDAEEVFKI